MLGGTELIQFLAAQAILHRDDVKKRMNRIMATWWNGCIEKMAHRQVHTTPNHHPPELDFLPKTCLQINLAAKWLVLHSSTSPNQQRRPLPSLLYLSFFYVDIVAYVVGGRLRWVRRGKVG